MNRILFGYVLLCLIWPLTGTAQEKDSLPEKVFYPEDSSLVRIKRLSLNSSQSDLGPQILNNDLIFASSRPNDVAVTYTNTLKTDVTDLFVADRRDSVHFSNARSFSKEINSPLNEGPFVFSKDGNSIYFSGNVREKGRDKGAGAIQIYSSTKVKKNEWSKPERAAFSDPAWSCFHPALSEDNSWVIFCSDKPGGYGGTDLYGSHYVNGQWEPAVNLGPAVNTPSNELFPFISREGILYFSSNKTGGTGGLDLYQTTLSGINAGAVKPLPSPVNSSSDDFGFCTDSTGNSGYFTSNRIPKYSDDIYYFYKYPDFQDAKTPPVKSKFCYTFYEEGEYENNDSINMTYEWDFGDGKKARGAKVKYCFNKPGDYAVQLNIVEKNSGLVFYNKVSYTITVDPPPGITIECPVTGATGTELMIDTDKSLLKGYTLLDFYWDFGDGRYNQGRRVKHTYRKSGTYKIELGVTAKNEQTQKIEKFRVEKNIIIKDTI